MTNMNVSNSTLRVLNTQQAKTLVNDILGNDGVVDKTDKDKLVELQTLLETAAKDGDDGTIDAAEDDFIEALTDHHYILGVNAGTSEAYLSQNLKAIQNAQRSADTEATEVNFDGVNITTDGLFSDDVRVVRLRDSLPTNSTSGSTSPVNSNPSEGSGTTAIDPANGSGTSETPTNPAAGTQGNTVTPTSPVNNYTPTQPPTVAAPSTVVEPPGNASQLGSQVNDYKQSVTTLQTEVKTVRDMLNDPQQVSNEQLQTGIQNLVAKDPARAIQQLARMNGYTNDRQMLDAMQQAGSITAADVSTLQGYLSNPSKFSELSGHPLANNRTAPDAIRSFLAQNPLSDQQLNGYRTLLVSTADNYLRDPSPQNQAAVGSELYDNNYIFAKGATPTQEAAYQRLAPALSGANQSLARVNEANSLLNGTSSVINPSSGPPIQSAQDLARAMARTQDTSQATIQAFSGDVNKALNYLKESPDQYPGQAGDIAEIEAKMQALNTAQTPQEKLSIINSISPALDELYEKTNLSQGAAGVDTARLMDQLNAIAANPESTQQTRDAVNFLTQYPELLQGAQQLSDYSEILRSLDRPPMSTNPLTADQQALKSALQTGDVAKVNQLYLNEMFSSFNLNFGGLPWIGGFFGGASATTENSPLAENGNNTPPEPLPGNWSTSSSLAATLQNATPARRQEIMAALRSPQAQLTAQAIQSNSALQSVSETYSRAQAASNSIQQGYISAGSSFDTTQANMANQQNLQPNLQIELGNASAAIDQALNKGDLAPVVKDKLTAQKAAIDRALSLMEQGKFDETAASAPDMRALDDVLKAIGTNSGNPPPMPIGLVLQREASIQALSEATANPENMRKLEQALKDNPAYAHIFAKDGEGNYKFPGQLTELLKGEELTPDALALLLNQSNRAIELIDSAKSRSVDTLKANYTKGKDMHQSKDGVQHDFYSGFMALESLNTIAQTSQARGNLSQTQILNSIAGQQNVSALLDNPDKGARRDAITLAMRSENIESGTTQARQERLDTYIQEAQSFEKTPSGIMLDAIFSAEAGSEGRQIINEQLSKITPAVDVSTINSKEDLFRQLSPEQIQQFQDNVAKMDYGPARKEIEAQRSGFMATINNLNPPLSPAYVEGQQYDTSRMLPGPEKNIVERLNALNQTSQGINTVRDTIKDIFAKEDTKSLFQAGQALNDISQDLRSNMGSALTSLDEDIALIPQAARDYLSNSNLPARPKPTTSDGRPNSNYEKEVNTYVKAVQDNLQAYRATVPASEQAGIERVTQRAQQVQTLSNASGAINAGNISRITQAQRSEFTGALGPFLERNETMVAQGSQEITALLNNQTTVSALDSLPPVTVNNRTMPLSEAIRSLRDSGKTDQINALLPSGPGLTQAQTTAIEEIRTAVTTVTAGTAGTETVQAVVNGDISEQEGLDRLTSNTSHFDITRLINRLPSQLRGAAHTAFEDFKRNNPRPTVAQTESFLNNPQFQALFANNSDLSSYINGQFRQQTQLLQSVLTEANQSPSAANTAINASFNIMGQELARNNPSPGAAQTATQNLIAQDSQDAFTRASTDGTATMARVYQEADRTNDYSFADSLTTTLDRQNQNVVRAQIESFLEISKSTGIPYTPSSETLASVGLSPQIAEGEQKAAELVAKANELADRLVLAPKGADSEELLTSLITDFINIIRDQDYKTRQLVLAQLANQMMTDSITNFYKDKTDKNNKYHQEALSRMASSFEQNIQKSIQSSLVASASGSDAQSVAAVSGQVGAAGTAEAMSVAQLRSTTEQLLSQAQQIEPPLITNQQKEQILNSLFDNDPNNDAQGILMLAGLQSVN